MLALSPAALATERNDTPSAPAAATTKDSAHTFSRANSFNGCTGSHGAGEQVAKLIPLCNLRDGETQEMRLVVSGEGLGLFVRVEGTLAPGAGMRRGESQISHGGPISVSGERVEPQFSFTPTSGAVRFDISTLMTNADRGRGSDRRREHEFDFVVGCEAELYYQDQDTGRWGGSERCSSALAGRTKTTSPAPATATTSGTKFTPRPKSRATSAMTTATTSSTTAPKK